MSDKVIELILEQEQLADSQGSALGLTEMIEAEIERNGSIK